MSDSLVGLASFQPDFLGQVLGKIEEQFVGQHSHAQFLLFPTQSSNVFRYLLLRRRLRQFRQMHEYFTADSIQEFGRQGLLEIRCQRRNELILFHLEFDEFLHLPLVLVSLGTVLRLPQCLHDLLIDELGILLRHVIHQPH